MVVLRQRRKELRELLFLFFQETKERERERTQKRAVSTHVRGEKKLLKKILKFFPKRAFCLRIKKKERQQISPQPWLARNTSPAILRTSRGVRSRGRRSSPFLLCFVRHHHSSWVRLLRSFFSFFLFWSVGEKNIFKRSTFFLV